ncbi:MAG: High molecular weight rubredoxin [Chloroflexi bacterium]|jgi:flavin reductase (DIM6/NTAB) family NADH-FMN oxidoreductase RutF/rubredoxin|nr:High molecular weight rubredoxin [Chloroflexota bacterium]MBT7081235.1 High molecular weight rubredoxin [Chloroflexota bacterium]MBT7289946.1 High molecular weight rubredoxin [Chloroflexota bacterium]
MDAAALYSISYGLYVVCSGTGDKLNGQIANTVIQVSAHPPTLSVCINKENLTHKLITQSGVFTVSVLSQNAPLSFIGNFGFKSGRDTSKLDGINYKIGQTGAPVVLENAVAYFEVKVNHQTEVATHTDFIGELVAAEVLTKDEPMTYAYYHKVKKGTTPKNAPSYVEEKKIEGVSKMQKYQCSVCDYIYDPAAGDPENGVAAGTAWEDLPEDWDCPMCGASKDEFEKVD